MQGDGRVTPKAVRRRVERVHRRLAGDARGSVVQWFADQVGVHYTTVYRWLRGESRIPRHVVLAIETLERRADDKEGTDERERRHEGDGAN